MDVSAGTLLILESKSLVQFSCLESHWLYWGFEFDVFGEPALPVARVLPVPLAISEGKHVSNIVDSFRSVDCHVRSQGGAEFKSLLDRWLRGDVVAASCTTIREEPTEPIALIVTEMHNRLDGSLTVSRMASMACLSESHFRRRFLRMTGETPKKHYDGLRLAWADEALRCGRMNVTEVAYALGFSSPFHFSRVFRQHFGCPPSHRIKLACRCPDDDV
jgi:AraC-like DNA-binding protein